MKQSRWNLSPSTPKLIAVPYHFQRDEDNDFIGDACDPDIDEDGLPNALDLCPYSNVTTEDDRDGDGVGDICDNCPDELVTE